MIKFFSSRSAQEHHKLRIESGVFIAISSTETSIAFHLPTVNIEKLEKVFKRTQYELQSVESSWDLQIVGNRNDLKVSQDFFKENNCCSFKDKERNDSFNLLYNSKDGSLKISKQKELENEPKTAIIGKTKVLIVEDSKTMRGILERIFSESGDFEVIGSLEKGEDVKFFLENKKPDVMTLDINLPGMSGLDILKEVPKELQVPTVLITSLNMNDSNHVFECLEAGAIDYIQKPSLEELKNQTQTIIDKVKMAASANMNSVTNHESPVKHGLVGSMNLDIPIFIGSSTGGTVALQEIFEALPDKIPPIIVVQHIPAVFSKSFADRLDLCVKFKVKEAEQGDTLKPNQVLIAPGGKQMALSKNEKGLYCVEINDDEPVNRFKPSVDYLFFSVSKVYKGPKVGAILTGMGKDGAKGLLELKNSGAMTLAQNKESCVVFGMPRAAIELNAADKIEDLINIPRKLAEMTLSIGSKRRAS